MKLSVILSTVAATAYAAVPPNAQWFTLSTKSNVASINNLFLSSKNGKVGAYAGSRETANVGGKFFTTVYAPTGTLSLQPGDDGSQIALQLLNPGLLTLVDLKNPTADSIRGKPTEWSVFTIAPDGTLGVKDGAIIPSRQWVSYLDTNGVYYVGLWDGFTKQPRSLANITIIATKTSPSYDDRKN